MPVVSLQEIVGRAFDERYGVPAINIVNDLTKPGRPSSKSYSNQVGPMRLRRRPEIP